MLFQANMPMKFWAEAIKDAAYICNLLPHSSLPNNITPYELWINRESIYEHLRPFGCIVWTYIPKE